MRSKSSFSISLTVTSSRRIPASASANQGPDKGGLIPQGAAPLTRPPKRTKSRLEDLQSECPTRARAETGGDRRRPMETSGDKL